MDIDSQNQLVAGQVIALNDEGMSLVQLDQGEMALTRTAVVGDKVLLKLLPKRRKGPLRALLHSVYEASPKSVPAKCSHFGFCGGCSTQRIPYLDQCRDKQQKIEQLFASIAPEGAILPIQGMQEPWHYRNKMEFSFSQNKKGSKFLGLVMGQSRQAVMNTQECPISPRWFTEALAKVRTCWEESSLDACDRGVGVLRSLTLREGLSGEKLAIFLVQGKQEKILFQGFIEALQGIESLSIVLVQQISQKGVPTRFEEEVLQGKASVQEQLNLFGLQPLHFEVAALAFFQPNRVQAEKIYESALKLAGLTQEMTALDLYCGTGTLGIAASFFAKKVIGIELNPMAVESAKKNAKSNLAHRYEVHCLDVGSAKEILNEKVEVVFVDPPRAGLSDEAIKNILNVEPQKIVYISCNPETQKENAEKFLQAGYAIVSIQPIDQFPHTPHVENIVLFVKRDHASISI